MNPNNDNDWLGEQLHRLHVSNQEKDAQIVELRVRLRDNERWAATLQSNLNTAIAVGHAEQRKVRALLDLLTPDQIKAAFLAMLEDL